MPCVYVHHYWGSSVSLIAIQWKINECCESVTNQTLVQTNFLLLRIACYCHAETTQPPEGENISHDAQLDSQNKACLFAVPITVWPYKVSLFLVYSPFRGSVSTQQEFKLAHWCGGCLQYADQRFIDSPGHVVYIFRCKVERFYLWMTSLESTEKKWRVFLITRKHRNSYI